MHWSYIIVAQTQIQHIGVVSVKTVWTGENVMKLSVLSPVPVNWKHAQLYHYSMSPVVDVSYLASVYNMYLLRTN